jgi:hypothetical protein
MGDIVLSDVSGVRLAARGVLSRLPYLPEWLWRQRHPDLERYPTYPLDNLVEHLPGWVAAVQRASPELAAREPKHVLVFGLLRWWLSHSAALSSLLVAAGHHVDLYGLAYRDWREPVSRYDLRQMREYQRKVMSLAAPIFRYRDLSLAQPGSLPAALENRLEQQSRIDVQYTLQREDLDLEGDSEQQELYRLRLARNRRAAGTLARVIREGRYDAMIVPNGSILEFGAAYQTARSVNLPVVTYEFGEQRDRIWLAQNGEVMRHDTTQLWKAHRGERLVPAEQAKLEEMYAARQSGRAWSTFARKWQSTEARGSMDARRSLGLDPDRPLVLLCTNVVGDSLTLGRQIFTRGMADWLVRTARFFANRTGAQLVVRVHPGELLGAGQPSVDVIQSALPKLPPHVLVIPPEGEVNTYDLIELASLGLVYTTTVGMEMAMAGVPVVVAGQTHYRDKGFTHDPETWEAYTAKIDQVLADPASSRLTEQQIEEAYRYAYLFFFKFARPFPYHIVNFWQDVEAHPLAELLEPETFSSYRPTLQAMVGDAISWT